MMGKEKYLISREKMRIEIKDEFFSLSHRFSWRILVQISTTLPLCYSDFCHRLQERVAAPRIKIEKMKIRKKI